MNAGLSLYGMSPDDEPVYPCDLSQKLRAARARDYGTPVHGTCLICGAIGECYKLGAVLLCGDDMDAAHKSANAVSHA